MQELKKNNKKRKKKKNINCGNKIILKNTLKSYMKKDLNQ